MVNTRIQEKEVIQEKTEQLMETWVLSIEVHDTIDAYYADKTPPRKLLPRISTRLEFTVSRGDNLAAKLLVLKCLQNARKRLRVTDQHRMIYCDAMPRLTTGTLDGDRILRLKDKFKNSPLLLRIKNPNVALVQGYGPEARDQIEGRKA